jgi:hypothetical protein
MCKTSWVRIPLASATKLWETKERQAWHDDDVWHDLDFFMARCNSMYMILNEIEHVYTVTARLHRIIYVVFHARRINRPISLDGIDHMYIITARLHMMIYVMLCLMYTYACISWMFWKLVYEYSWVGWYIYIYIVCFRWDYMYMLPIGRLEHVYVFTTM